MGIAGRQSSRNAMAKISSDTPKDSRAGTPRPGKSAGVGDKVGDKAKLVGDKATAEKIVKAGDKEKVKKRKLKAEGEDAEPETPKKKKKILLKKRGAEKTVPPKVDGGVEKTSKVGNGEAKVGDGLKEQGGEKVEKNV